MIEVERKEPIPVELGRKMKENAPKLMQPFSFVWQGRLRRRSRVLFGRIEIDRPFLATDVAVTDTKVNWWIGLGGGLTLTRFPLCRCLANPQSPHYFDRPLWFADGDVIVIELHSYNGEPMKKAHQFQVSIGGMPRR